MTTKKKTLFGTLLAVPMFRRTTKKPRRAGHWWYRENAMQGWYVVEVERTGGELWVYARGWMDPMRLCVGDWSDASIPEPEEP